MKIFTKTRDPLKNTVKNAGSDEKYRKKAGIRSKIPQILQRIIIDIQQKNRLK